MNTPVEMISLEMAQQSNRPTRRTIVTWVAAVLVAFTAAVGWHVYQDADFLCGGQSRVDGVCLLPKSSNPADYVHIEGVPLAPAPQGPADDAMSR